MGNLFGVRKRAPKVTEQDKAIFQLKQQRDNIKIYQRRTENELAASKALATKLYNDNKIDRALIILRRKKCMEEILQRTDQQLETLEGLVNDIEFSQIQVSVVEGLKVGNEALKQLNSLVSIENLEQIMQETEEATEKQREITRILQQTSERYDEKELLEELEQRAQESDQATKDDTIDKPKEKVDQQKTTPIDTLIEHKLPEIPALPAEELSKEVTSSKAKEETAEVLELAS